LTAAANSCDSFLGDDADIATVERAIADYPLDDEHKAALWLWAIAPSIPPPCAASTFEAEHEHPNR